MIRPCKKCGSTRRSPPRKGHSHGDCLDCVHEYNTSRKARAAGRRYDASEKGKTRQRRSNWKHQGIACDDATYDAMFAKQKGCCAACGIAQNQLRRRFDVDHNHHTEALRGLLCWECNIIARHPDRVRAVLSYMERETGPRNPRQ